MAIITISPKGTLPINQKRSKTRLALARLTKVVKYIHDRKFYTRRSPTAATRKSGPS